MHLRAVQKRGQFETVTVIYIYIYIYIYKDIYIFNRISFKRETPNWVMLYTTMIRKTGYTLGGDGVKLAGLWWVGAVAMRRGAGRPTAAMKMIRVLRLGSD